MNWLTLLGKLDGAITVGAASFAVYDPAQAKLAICVAGVAAAVGYALNAISHALGGTDVAPTPPAAPPGLPS